MPNLVRTAVTEEMMVDGFTKMKLSIDEQIKDIQEENTAKLDTIISEIYNSKREINDNIDKMNSFNIRKFKQLNEELECIEKYCDNIEDVLTDHTHSIFMATKVNDCVYSGNLSRIKAKQKAGATLLFIAYLLGFGIYLFLDYPSGVDWGLADKIPYLVLHFMVASAVWLFGCLIFAMYIFAEERSILEDYNTATAELIRDIFKYYKDSDKLSPCEEDELEELCKQLGKAYPKEQKNKVS